MLAAVILKTKKLTAALQYEASESVFWELSVPDFVPIHLVVAKI